MSKTGVIINILLSLFSGQKPFYLTIKVSCCDDL